MKFKTNIMCGNCLSKVSPVLNNAEGIGKWEVNLTDPQRVLSVENSKYNAEEIIAFVNKVGFKAEIID